MVRLRFLSYITLAALAGCAVGPDFQQPKAPDVTSFTSTPLTAETVTAPVAGGNAQHLISGKEIPAQWWTLYRSPDLDALIHQALASSPTLAAAQAALRQSQENLKAVTGAKLSPAVDAGAVVSRSKISGAEFGQPNTTFSPFTLYNASVIVSYSLDLFGGARRELEALRSQVDLQGYLLTGADITLTANIVTAAVKDASLRATIKATREIADAQEQQLDIVEKQFQVGAVAKTDVLAQRTQLAQTRALIPPLEKEEAQNRHLLAVLAGKLPSEASSLPEFSLESFALPEDLPVSLPSSLVRQRPDILASESVLHTASARIGVATANLYPSITLTGSYGSQAVSSAGLFKSGSSVWGLGAGLVQPLFHGGELTARKREAVAVYDQAAAQYRDTVLKAFQNVADVLRALELDALALKTQADAEAAARESAEIAQKQFRLGAVNYLTLLNSERRYLEARVALVQAQAARYADTAALFQALGGGWWNRTATGNEAGPAVSLR